MASQINKSPMEELTRICKEYKVELAWLMETLAESTPAPTCECAVPHLTPGKHEVTDKQKIANNPAAHAAVLEKFQAKLEEYRKVSGEKEAAQEKLIELLTAERDELRKENASLYEALGGVSDLI